MDEFLNVKGNVAELLLHGIVGKEINGTEIATKLKALKDLGVKHVKERINSVGGSIISGYSIVAANLDMTANGIIVETINEGVADSMSSVILASGTRGYRNAKDYSTSVIHNPLFNGTSLNDMKDEGLKAMLTSFKNSLLAIYAAALGKTKEELSETMNEERMLDAEQMQKIGLIDNIIPTSINKPEIKNKSLAELMIEYEAININTNKKERKMDKLTSFYALSKDASEDSLLDAAKAERQKLEDVTKKVQNLEKDLKEKTEAYDAQVLELAKFQDEVVELAVKAAIDSGKFDEKEKEALVNKAKEMGVDNFNFMIDKMKVPHVDVVGMIVTGKGGAHASTKKPEMYEKVVDGKIVNKVFEDFASEKELEQLKSAHPDKFEAIIKEFDEREVE